MTARLEEAATMTRPPHTPETCPTCGGATTTSPALALGLVTLGPVARRVFDALYRAGGWMTTADLRRAVWGEWTDRTTLHSLRRYIRPRLIAAGWDIETSYVAGAWRLVRTREARP
jgi:hypothetical protein